jgi:hypothetical protein
MDIKKICIANLGKEINYGEFKGMVVGYNIVLGFLILSMTNSYGWDLLKHTDIILLRSPLNVSYVLANPKYYKEQLIL